MTRDPCMSSRGIRDQIWIMNLQREVAAKVHQFVSADNRSRYVQSAANYRVRKYGGIRNYTALAELAAALKIAELCNEGSGVHAGTAAKINGWHETSALVHPHSIIDPYSRFDLLARQCNRAAAEEGIDNQAAKIVSIPHPIHML
jgi:hypothetical protein